MEALNRTVPSKERICPHGISLRFDCYQCAFSHIKQGQPGVCPHWVPRNQHCYACQRLDSRKDPFTQRPYIPVRNEKLQADSVPGYDDFFRQQQVGSNDIYSPQVTASFQGYVNPNSDNRDFPKPINSVGGGRYHPSTDPRRAVASGRDATHRSSYRSEHDGNSMGLFMARSIDESNFISTQKSNEMWGNPLIKRNFPTEQKKIENPEPINSSSSSHAGINSRASRKIDSAGTNEDLFLRRSMIQPDMRHGNRFFEIMPDSDRRESYRQSDNMRNAQFQQDTATLYKTQDFKKAFDTGASVGRGGYQNMNYPESRNNPVGW